MSPGHFSAPWMTLEAFQAGGAIEQRTKHFVDTHGTRCHAIWLADLVRFSAGRELTTGLVHEHAKQSLDHWAMARAAALVQSGSFRKPQSEKTGVKTGRAAAQPAGGSLAEAKRKLMRGRR